MIKKILNTIKSWFSVLMYQEVLFYIVLVVLMIPNILLAVTEPLTTLERVCSVVFPLSCYYLIFTLSRRLGWSIWLLCPMSLLAGFQVVLLYIYGKSVVATDMFLNMVTTDAKESKELLGSILMILSVVVLLYITPLVLATISLF
jgi:glucan phosphoethanolaminetransferase (alkaline phosphatase superfamily)